MSGSKIPTSAVFPIGIPSAIGQMNKSIPTIEVYIEDGGVVSKQIWEILLNKIKPENYEISVYSLNGKVNVIGHCEKDQKEDGRRKLFIIDADLDLLSGVQVPNLKYLFRVRGYCLENYLIEELNLLKLCEFLHIKGQITDYEERFAFTDWKNYNKIIFEKLFVCYAVYQKLGGKKNTIKFDVSKLCQSQPNNDLLCLKKVNSRISDLYGDLVENGYSEEVIRETKLSIKQNAKKIDFMQYACGKSHLLVLILQRMKNKKFQLTNTDLIKKKLAEGVSEDFDRNLKQRLQSICEKNPHPSIKQ